MTNTNETDSLQLPRPKMDIPWAAVADLLKACGDPAPDRRKYSKIEYEHGLLSITRWRLDERGMKMDVPTQFGYRPAEETFEIRVI